MPRARTASTAAGSVGLEGERGGRRVLDVGHGGGDVGLADEGHLPGQALEGHAGQGVLIGAAVDLAAVDLLGRDVGERAREAAGRASGSVSLPPRLVSPKSVR